ncbi:MAG: hypothetical protein BAJALOKI1v1_110040 [Promethearchaeota archaeon]|nr:MAG: hypothetical protein BAJALOKI1v1_110040 [Candidatus Lokiarchaeota archaeon]
MLSISSTIDILQNYIKTGFHTGEPKYINLYDFLLNVKYEEDYWCGYFRR